MALDGIAVSNIVNELKLNILNGKIDKIYQPENDEIIFTIRTFGNTKKLLLTANASNPRIHFTSISANNPMQPPLFCMVLRKHILNGKIVDIIQPDFERIVIIYIESVNELGDYSVKRIILEIMGRHSNIILVDDNDIILDSIKHINFEKSSIREVLPGKKYIFPPSQNKTNPLNLNREILKLNINNKSSLKITDVLYKSFTGISPICASEICFRACINPAKYAEELDENEINNLYSKFYEIIEIIKLSKFSPEIIFNEKNNIIDFFSIESKQFINNKKQKFNSISKLMEFFYKNRDLTYRMNQKTQDLKRLVQQNIERCIKKKDIQNKTLKEISKRETKKLYGELITANIYSIKKGMTNFITQNFYDENCSEITIPLDGNLTPSENAQKYFKRYNKEKRTFTALQMQIKQNDEELNYLETIMTSIQNCIDEQDIKEIRQELSEQGFIKKVQSKKNKQSQKKSKPLHFISSDGFDIYVGKNNKQNDELTLKFAKSNDIWLHTKDIPGSHVIIVSNNKEIPSSTLNEGALLAAFYSKAKNSSMVPVDYTMRKNVKKPSGSKPGFVIYETNKTAYITPSEQLVNQMKIE